MSKKALTKVEGQNGSAAKDPKEVKKTAESKKIEFKAPTKIVKRDGRIYEKKISNEDIECAKQNFARDVNGLRRYFDIRTFIPHGAGEANNQLFDIPEGYDDLTWVYNNTRKNGTVPN